MLAVRPNEHVDRYVSIAPINFWKFKDAIKGI